MHVLISGLTALVVREGLNRESVRTTVRHVRDGRVAHDVRRDLPQQLPGHQQITFVKGSLTGITEGIPVLLLRNGKRPGQVQ